MAKELRPEVVNPPPAVSTLMRPSGGSPLRWLLPVVLSLLAVMVLVWTTRPKPEAVYEPPPAPKKTVEQVQQEIKTIQNNAKIPPNDKARILGFLQGDLEKARVGDKALDSKK